MSMIISTAKGYLQLTSTFFTSVSSVSPQGIAVSVGGADSSVGIAQVTTEWPDTWSRLHSGTYRAHVDVSLAALSGSGTWTVFIMNAWSLSERVEYDVSVGFRFRGRPDYLTGGTCGPTASPTPIETSAPSISMGPTHSPTRIPKGSAQYVIPIDTVSLGVRDNGQSLVQDKKALHSFSFTGSLTAIEVNLDPYSEGYETRGTNAWLLVVAVTDPWGLVAQVGGSGWLKKPDGFYSRNWPDPWLGQFSEGKPWLGTRDVHAAGLGNITINESINDNGDRYFGSSLESASLSSGDTSSRYDDFYYYHDETIVKKTDKEIKKEKYKAITPSTKKPTGLWTVDLAIGFPWTVRSAVNYSGSVILHFTDTLESGVIMAYPFRPKPPHSMSTNSPTSESVKVPSSGDNDNTAPSISRPNGPESNFNSSTNSTNGGDNRNGDGDGTIPYPDPNPPADPGVGSDRSNHGGVQPHKPDSGTDVPHTGDTNKKNITSPEDNPTTHTTRYSLFAKAIYVTAWLIFTLGLLLLLAYILSSVFKYNFQPFGQPTGDETTRLVSVEVADNTHTGGEKMYVNMLKTFPQKNKPPSTDTGLTTERTYGSTII